MADLDPYAPPRTSPTDPPAGSAHRPSRPRLRWLPIALLIPLILANLGLALGAAHFMLGEPLNSGSDHSLPRHLFPLLSLQVAYSLGMGLVGAVAIRSWHGCRWWRASLATAGYALLAAPVAIVLWLLSLSAD